ncbi:MAG: UDP-N-acetylmuramoyl-tripeptide--D-alanyl-D-alanine ligase [Gemmatimonadota bacterium]|nr:UDP-N-acetylmuramoyl-tripeptide--D-alanyl-D-alanine ligase [Gemmatimonadota bacterium]
MTVLAAPRPLTSGTLRQALGLSGAAAEDRVYVGVSIDSRTIRPGELFVALRGERHDAADFLPQVAERGGAGAIVAEGRVDPGLPLEYFPVADPGEALRTLAGEVRRRAVATVVAVTGSSGKTTVKEMVAAALGEERRVYRTAGNLNSQVGVPLTILRAPAEADLWVLEVGASEPGEIGRLAEVAAPDHVIVTTVGAAHLERFGDVEGVLAEKLELARRASATGTLVVGEEPPMLAAAATALRSGAIVAGIGPDATYRPETYEIEAERVAFERGGARVEIAAGGEHHLRDALIAAALAEALGTPPGSLADGLARYEPLGMRGAVRHLAELTLLADCYNANPDSFRAAIAQCRDLFPGRRRAAFIGSMLELGDAEEAAHAEVAGLLIGAGFELIAATGLFAEALFDEPPGVTIVRAADPLEAWEPFARHLAGDEVVLVKGSRGARLERIVERLEGRGEGTDRSSAGEGAA